MGEGMDGTFAAELQGRGSCEKSVYGAGCGTGYVERGTERDTKSYGMSLTPYK